MTREIKCRAWDKEKKKMVYCSLALIDDYHVACRNPIMQYTGLKDKNGKKIYDGDLLKQGEGEHETLIEVRFGDGTFDSGCYHFTGFYGVYLKIGFGGGFKSGDLCEDMDEITKEPCKRREVIGNIYENKDLLEENKHGKN